MGDRVNNDHRVGLVEESFIGVGYALCIVRVEINFVGVGLVAWVPFVWR